MVSRDEKLEESVELDGLVEELSVLEVLVRLDTSLLLSNPEVGDNVVPAVSW